MLVFIAISIQLLCIVSSSHEKEWITHGSYKYYIAQEGVTRTEAASKCSDKDAELVKIQDIQTQQFLEKEINKNLQSKLVSFSMLLNDNYHKLLPETKNLKCYKRIELT